MDKKITLTSIAVAAAIAIGVGVTKLDFSDKSAGPVSGDKCVAGLVQWSRENRIECRVETIKLDGHATEAWMCNGGYAPDQKCLTDIATVSDPGTAISFQGSACATGVCWVAAAKKVQ